MLPTISTDEIGPYFTFESAGQKLIVRPSLEPRFKIGVKSDLLAKAIGLKKSHKLRVIDATAGFCRDSYHLASLGCDVLAVEANLQIFTVMKHYVAEANQILESPIELIHSNSVDTLRELSAKFQADLIFLDPMFPGQEKSAKSAKDTELLKQLVQPPSQEEERRLLEAAWQSIGKGQRVIVKRSKLAPPLGFGSRGGFKFGLKFVSPSNQMIGKAVRYDIYLKHGSPHDDFKKSESRLV